MEITKISQDCLSIVFSYCDLVAASKFLRLNKFTQAKIENNEWQRNWTNDDLFELAESKPDLRLLKLALKSSNINPTAQWNKAITNAVKSNNIGVVKILMDDGRAEGSTGHWDLVNICCDYYYMEMLHLILGHENLRFNENQVINLLGISACYVEIKEYLVDGDNYLKFLNAIILDRVKWYFAFRLESMKIVDFLVQSNTNFNDDQFIYGVLDVLKRNLNLLNFICNSVHARLIFNPLFLEGCFAEGHFKTIEFLLNHSTAEQHFAENHLAFLCKFDQIEPLELVLQKYPHVNLYEKQIQTIVRSNKVKVMRVLLQHRKLDLTFNDNFCLRYTAAKGYKEMHSLISNS